MRRGSWMLVLLMAMILTAGTTFSQPANAAESTKCPSYTYSDWTKSNEDRWYEGQWVMQRLHYVRTRTDTCDGSRTTEQKSEGPFRLWQAVPDRRIADVNRPAGTDEPVTGSPLQIGSGVEFRPRLSSTPEPEVDFKTAPVAAPERTSPSNDSSRQVDTGQPYKSPLSPWKTIWPWAAAVMVGLLGIPILDTLRREPIIQDPLSWLAQIGDAIAQGWTWIRCNPVVWFVTEVIRRIVLVAWGLVYFVGSTIWSVVKLLGSLAMGLANLVWGNIKSVWQFATGSNEIRRDMLVGFRDRWFTKDAWIERWESAEFFGAMFVTSIVDTWKRWWHGLGRAFTDPDMSNEDLIQLGEDTGSVVCDALIVAEGAGAVVRAVRGASWFGRVGELSEFGKLGRAGQLAEAYRIAGVLSDAGYRSITAYRVWRVMQAAEREVEFAKLLSQLPKSHHNTIMALIEQGYLQWEGSKLKGVSGTIKPWKLAKALASGQARDVEQLMHQIEGGLGQTVVREFMTKEVGFRHFILDFRNPSATGLDALAQYSDSIVAVEVKNLSRTVGANEISKYLTVRDGVAKFEVKDLLNEIGRRAGLSAQLNAAQAIQNGTFVFRIELVGTAPTKATADLMAMNGKVVDGVKIIVLPR